MAGIGAMAGAVGKGLAAGLVGTAVMTVSSTLEAKLRGRPPSTTPMTALQNVLHVKPADEAGERILNWVAHLGYGTQLGALRGLLAAFGLRGLPATGAHFGLVWGMEQVTLPVTGASTPAWKWSGTEVAIDAWHHVVYAVATGIAYEWIDRH